MNTYHNLLIDIEDGYERIKKQQDILLDMYWTSVGLDVKYAESLLKELTGIQNELERLEKEVKEVF